MLITNEFIIERYLGSQSMPLLTPPTNIDNILLAQYNTFMSNILSIYGSQNTNGSIPVFFKNSDGTPSTSSTLTSLQSGQEYYFISKNTASFPYPIPAIGGLVSDPVSTPMPTQPCPGLPRCCPSVAFPSGTLSLSGPPENIYGYVSASVSGLVPGRTYSYSYYPVAANWPSKIIPLSGTIYPTSDNDTIESVFSFCPSTGNCNDCLPYKLDCNTDKDYVKKNIYSILELKLDSGSLGCPTAADRLIVKCNQCLPPDPTPCAVRRPVPSFIGGPKISLAANCCANPVPVAINVTNAEPGKLYNYNFEAWPSTVQIIPSSGTAGFGDGTGKLSALVNLNSEQNAVVKFSLSETNNSETFVDFISIQCSIGC